MVAPPRLLAGRGPPAGRLDGAAQELGRGAQPFALALVERDLDDALDARAADDAGQAEVDVPYAVLTRQARRDGQHRVLVAQHGLADARHARGDGVGGVALALDDVGGGAAHAAQHLFEVGALQPRALTELPERHAGHARRRPRGYLRVAVLADDVRVDRARLDAEAAAEQRAQARRVEDRARA